MGTEVPFVKTVPQALGPGAVEATAGAQPSWVVLALGFLGAQLAVWPVLLFLALASGGFWFKPPGSLLAVGILLCAGVLVLRQPRQGVFVSQLGLTALLLGLALWAFTVGQWRWGSALAPILLLSVLAVAALLRTAWVQRVLGVLALLAWARVQLDPRTWVGDGWGSFAEMGYGINLLLAALGWAAWSLRAPSTRVVPAWVAPLMDGVVVGVLLEQVLQAAFLGRLGWWGAGVGALGSADVVGAGLAALWRVDAWALLSLLWVGLGAALLLRRGAQQGVWALSATAGAQAPWHWGLLYALWALLALAVPGVDVLALVFSVALLTQRTRVLVLTLLALLAKGLGFYYALQWPLAHKAALLAGAGALLGVALLGLHLVQRRSAAVGAGAAPPGGADGVAWQRLGVGLALLLVLGLTQWDVQRKEQVIAQGQRIYIPLVPRDPRSLMQGDYMALNFRLPDGFAAREDAQAQAEQAAQGAPSPLDSPLMVLAQLDERGVATLLRRVPAQHPVAANEVLVPVKYLKGRWTVVTDAYFFPEGQGRVLREARFGEFRALGAGRVLLVGLADEKLQHIEPRADRAGGP